MSRSTDVPAMFSDLDGGVFNEKIGLILSDVAAGVIDFEKQGEVTIKLSLKKIGNSCQVEVAHTLSHNTPTQNGNKTEKQTTSTPMHVGSGGKLSIFPENQMDLIGGGAKKVPATSE